MFKIINNIWKVDKKSFILETDMYMQFAKKGLNYYFNKIYMNLLNQKNK